MDRLTTIPGSTPLMNSQLDLFTLPATDVSVVSTSFNCIYPTYSIKQASAPIEFNLVGDNLHYIDLSKSFVYLRAKITLTDGEAVPAAKTVAPVNLFLHSLWDSCELLINGTLVSRSNSLYAYKAFIQKQLSNGDSAKKGLMTQEMYYKETKIGTWDATNLGFGDLCDLSRASKSFEVLGKPVESLFQQSRLLPPNTDIRLRFRRNCDQFILHGPELPATTATFPYTLVLEEAAFFPHRVIVNPEIHASQSQRISKGENALYPIRFADVKSFSIPSGSLNYVSESVFSGKLPELLIFCMVDSMGYAGTFHKNPFNFESFGLSSITVSVDNEPAIYRNLDIDVDNSKYLLGYHTLFSAVSNPILGNYITRADYKAGNFFLVFDLQNSNLGNRFNPDRVGSIKLDIKFKTALTKSVHALVYGQFQGVISIDGQRNVHLDHTN